MSYVFQQDVPNGRCGSAYITDANNEIHELFYLQALQAGADFNTATLPVIGKVIDQTKITGANYSGTFTIYKVTSLFNTWLAQYSRTGQLPVFTLNITENDESTSIGAERVVLYNCQVTNIPIVDLVAGTDVTTVQIGFTFADYELLDSYGEPTTIGQDLFA